MMPLDAMGFLLTKCNCVGVKYRRRLFKKCKSLFRDKNNFLLLEIFANENNPGRRFFVVFCFLFSQHL